jgi:hypothetical protein
MPRLKSFLMVSSIILVFSFLIAAGWEGLLYMNGWSGFAVSPPVEKQHPSDLLQVSGTIPDGISLQVVADYVTTNPRFQVSVNWLEDAGNYRPRRVTVNLPVRRQSGEYETTVPFDKFQKGEAAWAPSRLYFLLGTGDGAPREIDPAIDSRNNSDLGDPVLYFIPPRASSLADRPFVYGSDWTNLEITCRIYTDGEGIRRVISEDPVPGHPYYPTTGVERTLRVNLIAWKKAK